MSTSNLYARFTRLVPGAPLLVGDVVSTDGTTAVVELPDGQRVHARGSATAGSTVFVRGGALEGTAPALPLVTVTV